MRVLRAIRDQVHESQQVLVRVAEAHPPPDAGLEQRCRARQVERDHALVRVPDVDHPVRRARSASRPAGRRAAPTSGRAAGRTPPRPRADRGSARSPRGHARLSIVCDPGGSNFASRGSRRSRARTRPRGSRRARARAPRGASRTAPSRGRSSRGSGRPRRRPAGPSRGRDRGTPHAACRSPRARLGAGEVREVIAALAVLGLVVDRRRPRPRPRRSRGCAGSSSRRPMRPRGRTRRR